MRLPRRGRWQGRADTTIPSGLRKAKYSAGGRTNSPRYVRNPPTINECAPKIQRRQIPSYDKLMCSVGFYEKSEHRILDIEAYQFPADTALALHPPFFLNQAATLDRTLTRSSPGFRPVHCRRFERTCHELVSLVSFHLQPRSRTDPLCSCSSPRLLSRGEPHYAGTT